jgi:glycosyltransferase involved in cell wall biosynthesis
MTNCQISVAVCTFNRAHVVRGALDSLFLQTLRGDRFEIVIVDNGSNDDTRLVIEEYQGRTVEVRYVWEPRPGIAHARNRAAQEARGEYLAFLDDDAWAEPDWLSMLVESVCTVKPEPACVVGPVILEWEGGRPGWFPSKFEPLLCSYDMGPKGHFLGPHGYLLTTNVLMRREVLLGLGGFRTYLGRERGKLLGGEDNEICQRILGAGYGVYYAPTARVHHGVPRERQSERYLMRRVFWDGASQPFLDYGPKQARRFYALQAYQDLRRMARFGCEYFSALARHDQEQQTDSSLALVQRMGRLRTNLNLALTGKG